MCDTVVYNAEDFYDWQRRIANNFKAAQRCAISWKSRCMPECDSGSVVQNDRDCLRCLSHYCQHPPLDGWLQCQRCIGSGPISPDDYHRCQGLGMRGGGAKGSTSAAAAGKQVGHWVLMGLALLFLALIAWWVWTRA